MHTNHPDVHGSGLADDCPACAEHAETPFRSLDHEMLRSLVGIAVRRDRLSIARSEAEAVASAKVLTTLEQTGRMLETAPDEVVAYFRERWRIPVRIDA